MARPWLKGNMEDRNDNLRPWWADPRMLLVLAMLGGVGVGGSGATVIGAPAELRELAEQVEKLESKVDTALEWQTRSDSRISEFWARTFPRVEKSLESHEERIRNLEVLASEYVAERKARTRRGGR